jgi:biotin carboxyl carrier protein
LTRYFVTVGDHAHEVDITGGIVTIDGAVVEADLQGPQGSDVWSLLLRGRSHRVIATNGERGRWNMRIGGESFAARVVDERTRHIEEVTGFGGGPGGPAPVRAPMPGLIVRVEVAEGDEVEVGQGLVIIEAMKMENELRAESAALVGRVHVSEGQAVEKDEALIDLEPVIDGESDG